MPNRHVQRANGLLVNSAARARRAANGLMACGAVQWLLRHIF